MNARNPLDDVRRHRAVYVEAVRRAGRMGTAGRPAMESAHESYAVAMIEAGRSDLAKDAVTALIAARPSCRHAWSIAARAATVTGGRAA